MSRSDYKRLGTWYNYQGQLAALQRIDILDSGVHLPRCFHHRDCNCQYQLSTCSIQFFMDQMGRITRVNYLFKSNQSI